MAHATPEQLAYAKAYHDRMRADGYKYDWQAGTWIALPKPAASAGARDEVRDIDDHRGESNEDFENFLIELRLTHERPDPRKLVRNARAELRNVEKEAQALDWKRRALMADVEHEKNSAFHRNVDAVATEFITDDDYRTE